jgi:hypothetical protein
MSCCPLSLGHCIYCPSSIYDFWLPFWYQTLLRHYKKSHYVDLWSLLGWLSTLYMVLSQWGARVAQWVRLLDLTAHTSLSPIRRGFAPRFVNYKKGCTRLSTASDKVYQLLVQGRWSSPGTPAIGKPRMSPLLSLNTSAVIRYLVCVYSSHFFAGRPYHFNQTLRTANKF